MRKIVLHPTQLLDMQYLNPQVRLVLSAAVGSVTAGDPVNTLRYGRWQVRAVDPVCASEVTTISVIAELIEDAGLAGADHECGSEMDTLPLR